MKLSKNKNGGGRKTATFFLVNLANKRKKPLERRGLEIKNGAGDGNRTRVSTLARWCSTIELRLHHVT